MKFFIMMCVLTTITSVAGAPAVAQGSVTLGVVGGVEEVSGAFRTGHAFQPGIAGFVVGALAQFPLSSSRLSVRADVMYHQLGLGSCAQACVFARDNSRIVSGGLSLVGRLSDRSARLSPYVLAGVAGYGSSYADDNVTEMHPSHIGFTGGIGIEARSGKSIVFAELRYMAIPPGGVVPLTLGIRF